MSYMKRDIDKKGLPQLAAAEKLSVVYVSTFPPRKCGIATFTEDLSRAMDEMLAPAVTSRICAMNRDGVVSYRYPQKVIFQINQDNEEEYVSTAQSINLMDELKLVNIQHEFGIFGGEWGSNLVPFLEVLIKPVVITFHTVLPEPDEVLYNAVRSATESACGVIVMTTLARRILVEDYGIPDKKIKVIPHGIHSQPYTSSQQAKKLLGYSGRVVLSTFGLIGRSKGLEYVIDALPQVVRSFPDFVYIIVGATHPGVLREEGESYRKFIIEKIYKLGLYDHVRLYNKYFPLSELLNFLKASDIYVSPSLNPNQAVSGTLSYALGIGRPVISTAFAQAREIVTDDVGITVDFRNSQAYADAILQLVENEDHRLQLGMNAYFRTRNMTWHNVAVNYARFFSQCAPRLSGIIEQKSLPKIKLNHLIHLTDDFGIIQFAKLNKRDVSSGYALDDVARALTVAVLYYGRLGPSTKNPSVAKQKRDLIRIINTYIDFVSFVAQPDGSFQNFVNVDRTISNDLNELVNLDDANARTVYALAVTSTTGSLPSAIRQNAFDLLQKRMKFNVSFGSPRAVARYIKALCVLVNGKVLIEGIDLDNVIRRQCDRLVELYEDNNHADWEWFEKYLTYSNGVMPEALFLGYRVTRDERYLTVGRKTLDFLIKVSLINGIYMPVGQDGWFHRKGKRYHFDQQPEEVKSMVYALRAGFLVTGDEEYSRLMRQVFNWFLGENSLNQVVYDRTTGGCYDGVGRTAINLNQGAESTVSYLMARLAFA
ncbi:glycosyltransferase [Chloroflexota bacterium]